MSLRLTVKKYLWKKVNTSSMIFRVLNASRLGRVIGHGVHHCVIGGILFCIRRQSSHRKKQVCSRELHEVVTIIIKTFERPAALIRLVESIRFYYPNIPIVVADDSRVPISLPNIEVVPLAFRTGVSAGRAAALQRVKTPLFVSLDDDFIFWAKSDIGAMVEALEVNLDIDLMAGWLVNLPFFILSGPGGKLGIPKYRQVRYQSRVIGGYPTYNKVPQFYIARTEAIRSIGWDSRIKVLDHASFFGQLFGRITIVFNNQISILHARTPFDKNYMNFRREREDDQRILSKLTKYYDAHGCPRATY